MINLDKAEEQQKNILDTINELKKKKISEKRSGCPLGENNKNDVISIIKTAREIFKTRRDIIKAYKKARGEEKQI